MSKIRVRCPHCSFSREVVADQLPDQPVQATCPKCKQVFEFDKASAPVVTPVPAPVMTPPPLAGGAAAPPSPPPPPLPGNNHATGGGRTKGRVSRELLTVAELFEATWELYKQRWLVLLGIFIATAVACVVPPMLVSLGMGGMAKSSFGGLAVLIMSFGVAVCLSLLIACWGMAAALSAAVDERLGFNDSFNRAKSCWISLAWVSTLYSFIAGGASLLFLIPGILTGIWFFACPYLVVAEETRGMEALLKSKALVDGRFWPVTGRLVLVWLLGMLPGTIPIIGVIFSLLLAPFSMLYTVILYRNLSETAGTVSYSSSDGTKAAWLLLGLAGYILVPLLLFFVLGAAIVDNFMPMFNMMLQQGRPPHILSIDPATIRLLFSP